MLGKLRDCLYHMPSKKVSKAESSSKKDYTAVLLEDMRDSIKLLAESQQWLIQKVDRLDGRMEGFDNRMDRLDNRMDQLDIRVEEMDKKFTLFAKDTEEKFRISMEHLFRIEDELVDIKATLKGLDERKVDWPIVKDLIKRVENLEKELAAQRNMIKAK